MLFLMEPVQYNMVQAISQISLKLKENIPMAAVVSICLFNISPL